MSNSTSQINGLSNSEDLPFTPKKPQVNESKYQHLNKYLKVVQVKVGNTSDNLLKEQIVYS